jgi:hypothetical protein
MADAAHDDPARLSTAEPSGRCVVLSPPGGALLGLLLPALTGRWRAVAVIADEPGVMEELAAGGVTTLVVVEPVRWAHLAQLTDAVEHYYPGVGCMAYQVEPDGESSRIVSLHRERTECAPIAEETIGNLLPASAPASGSAAAVAAEVEADTRQQAGLPPASPPATPIDTPQRHHGSETPPAHGVYAIPGPTGIAPTARRQRVDQLAVRVDPPEPNEDDPHEALVTEDELTMLLGPGPGEVA